MPGLLPADADARARAIAWMFAALSTVEPPIVERSMAMLLERDKPWYEERLPLLEDRVRDRLGELSSRLGDADWLDGAFSAGDLLMVTVLRRLDGSGLLEEYPNLCRLCRPRRSAARLSARLRRSIGGVHRRPSARLTDPQSGVCRPITSRWYPEPGRSRPAEHRVLLLIREAGDDALIGVSGCARTTSSRSGSCGENTSSPSAARVQRARSAR